MPVHYSQHMPNAPKQAAKGHLQPVQFACYLTFEGMLHAEVQIQQRLLIRSLAVRQHASTVAGQPVPRGMSAVHPPYNCLSFLTPPLLEQHPA